MRGFAKTNECTLNYVSEAYRTEGLKQTLLKFSLFNFFVLAASGLLLRGMFLFEVFPLPFRNVLHGHSHFAFGGWVTPVLLWMIMTSFRELTGRIAFVHWRNICFMLMLSAYGMLVAFPLQGYGAVSIVFSTLSIVGTYYFAIALLRASKNNADVSVKFLRGALFFLMLSAAGPFAIGPLTVAGKVGTPLYFNCVYFYLHFQYNGWFSFAILAVLYRKLLPYLRDPFRRPVVALLFAGCLLTLFLSFLWNKPHIYFNVAGGIGAALQLTGTACVMYDIRRQKKHVVMSRLEWIAVSAFTLKLILQAISALPAIAAMAYEHRNFLIAYLHLVMLGFVTVFAWSVIMRTLGERVSRSLTTPFAVFLSSFVISELLLVFEASLSLYGIYVAQFPLHIFVISAGFPVSAYLLYKRATFFGKPLATL
jgi:hypothetical protein